MKMNEHNKRIIRYYKMSTRNYYINQWHNDHIHYGIFEENIDYKNNIHLAFLHLPAAVKRMTDTLVAPACIMKTDKVVDAGCGIGGTCIEIADTCGCRVTGVNISKLQLKIAKKKTKQVKLSSLIDYKWADCSFHLPFPDDSIDVIINIESACHYPDKERFVRECFRCLKPGGRMAGSDWMRCPGNNPLESELFCRDVCDSWYLFKLETLENYNRLFTIAGFTISTLRFLEQGILPNAYILNELYLHWFNQLWNGNRLLKKSEIMLKQFYSFSQGMLKGYVKIGQFFVIKE